MPNMDAEKNRRDIAKALLRDDPELARLYQTSAAFHGGFKALVGLLPEFIDFLAAKGGEQERAAEIARAHLEHGGTVSVANDRDLATNIEQIIAAQADVVRNVAREHAQATGHLVTDGRCLDCAWPNLPDLDAPQPYTGPRLVTGKDDDEH